MIDFLAWMRGQKCGVVAELKSGHYPDGFLVGTLKNMSAIKQATNNSNRRCKPKYCQKHPRRSGREILMTPSLRECVQSSREQDRESSNQQEYENIVAVDDK